jgi:Transmembrane protein 65
MTAKDPGLKSPVPKPSLQNLKTLFVASAIPMVGFGFMDNCVMIQAGQYIDSTIGVRLGLATMTAAAAGT